MQLAPQHLTLSELLNGRLFRIPDYQRAYAWGSKQRKDLFADIDEAYSSDQSHFMATVVGLAREKRRIETDDFRVVDVVDGQQRITTLVILLKAIEKTLSNKKGEKRARTELSELLVKQDDHALILLQTNHDSSNVFTDYVREGVVERPVTMTAADKNILDAIRDCEGYVEEWKSSNELLELVAILKNQLSMIYHELSDEGTVYRVFEVLNSRGLDVKWIDKLKSQLMGLIFQHVAEDGRDEVLSEMREIWKDIYRILGLRGTLGDDALQFAGTLKAENRRKKLLNVEQAAERLTELAGTDPKSIISIARWLKRVVESVDRLDKDVRLNAVTKIKHARCLATSIFLRKFSEDDEAELLKTWENITFRIYGLGGKDARYRVGEYTSTAFDVANKEVSAKEVHTLLNEIGETLSIDDAIASNDWSDCYSNWAEELRYLLFRYDERLAAESGEKLNTHNWNKIWTADLSKSIEHIKPQSSNVGYIHNLGNLTMLPPGVNSSLKDKPPIDKATRYTKEGIKATMKIGQEILASKQWKSSDVKRRTREIFEFIRKEWA